MNEFVRVILSDERFHSKRSPTFAMHVEGTGQPLGRSRQCRYDAARKLLAIGCPANILLTTRHDGLDHDSFNPAPIGDLAEYAITESDKGGLQRIRYTKHPGWPARTSGNDQG